MADRLSLTIGADFAQLFSQQKVLQASVRSMESDLNRLAKTAAKTGDELDKAKVGQAAGPLLQMKQALAGVTSEIENAGKATEGLNNGLRLNRGGLMELQAAGVNSFQALASGMDVFRVAMTEGAQVLGGLVQGGVLGFSTLLNPMALLITAAGAASAAIALMGIKAYQTQQNLESMRNQMQLTGRGTFDDKEMTAAADAIATKWNMSKDSVLAAIKAITEGSKGLTPGQVMAATELAAKEAAGSKTSISETAKKYSEIKDSAAAIAMMGKEFNLPGTDPELIKNAGNGYLLIENVLKRINDHLEAAIGAQSRLNAEIGKASWLGYETLFGQWLRQSGIGQTPGTTQDMLREHGQMGTGGFAGGEPGSGLGEATAAEKEALAEIRRREGGGRYDIFHANKQPVSTLADVRAFPGASHAFGAYGFQPDTYEAQAKALGFDPNDISVANQDRAALRLYRNVGPNSAASWAASGPYPMPAQSGAGANAVEQAKADEEKATRVQAAEEARRAIAHKNSLEAQLKDAEEHYAAMAAKYPKDSQQELDAATEVEQKKRALKDQSLALDLARINEQIAATNDAGKKAALVQQKIDVATKGGASPTEIQSLKTELAAAQRATTQEGLALELGKIRALQAATTDPAQKIALQERAISLSAGAPATQIQSLRTELEALKRGQTQEIFRQTEQGVGAMISARGDQFRGFQAEQAIGVREGRISPLESLDAQMAKSRELADENAAALNALGAAATSNTDQIKIYWELWREGVRAATEQQQLLAQKAQETKKLTDTWSAPIKTAFTNVESSLSSGVSGLLTGASTYAQVLKSVTNSMITGLVDSILGSLSKSAAKSLGATAGESLFEFIGGGIGSKLFGGAGAAAAGGAAGGGGIFGSLFSFLPALALSRGGIIPSAAGGWSLPSFAGAQPAMLHSREMVLPAHISDGLQSAIGGGGLGGGVNFHLHAVAADGPAISRLFRDNGRAIHDAVRSGIRNNALTPRTI